MPNNDDHANETDYAMATPIIDDDRASPDFSPMKMMCAKTWNFLCLLVPKPCQLPAMHFGTSQRLADDDRARKTDPKMLPKWDSLRICLMVPTFDDDDDKASTTDSELAREIDDLLAISTDPEDSESDDEHLSQLSALKFGESIFVGFSIFPFLCPC
jgi:hypothetical protein